MHARAYVVTLAERLPRIRLHLLHSEAYASRLRVDAEHFDFDRIAGIYDLAGMLDALGPAHFRDVDQTFHARLEFDEGAIIRDAGDFSRDARGWRKSFFNRLPGIGQQLFVAQGNSL